MNFRETLGRHLLAMETRDLDSLVETVGDNPVLITADGKLKRTKGDFVEAHRAWFATQGWTLTAKPVEIYEGSGLGIAVLRVGYREGGESGESYLTLIFERQGDQWRMVQEQNTAIR